jgi:hydrogenase maturation protein HypF
MAKMSRFWRWFATGRVTELDGTIWGGELLLCDLRGFNRLARLRPIALAGGDRAAKDIRRSALAVLLDTFGSTVLNESPAEQIMADQHQRHLVAQMIAARVNTIDSSGAGRLFDAVACLLGLAGRNDYEGQAAQALESCADQANPEIIPQPLAIELHPVEGRGDLLELGLAADDSLAGQSTVRGDGAGGSRGGFS